MLGRCGADWVGVGVIELVRGVEGVVMIDGREGVGWRGVVVSGECGVGIGVVGPDGLVDGVVGGMIKLGDCIWVCDWV